MARPKQFTANMQIRVTPKMVDRVKAEAKRLNMSDSDYVRVAVRTCLAATESARPKRKDKEQ